MSRAPARERAAPLRAVLFDLDGTLLDTAQDLAAALNELRGQEGLAPLEFARIRNHVSQGSAALVRIAFASAGEAELRALRARLLEIYRLALAVHTRPFAGMLELLERIERDGRRWGVVTNKPAFLTEPLLEQLALRRRAGVVVSGDTLPERKPHPRPLLHAAAQLGVAPEASVYVGDAERDMRAARAAGMRAVVACFGYIAPEETPRSWPADAWVRSPLEIHAWLQGMDVSR
ncbi:MAG TPA: phosphoglycolate phosphatase [Steroidobacteraceae bacterium]|nr:phosphoglycolate phosphatase [Steroidobacteraceae bacterium]